MDTYALEKLTGWTPELSPPPDSPLYRCACAGGRYSSAIARGDQKSVIPGRAKREPGISTIPGLVLRTIPE